jgi:hypothetical protein
MSVWSNLRAPALPVQSFRLRVTPGWRIYQKVWFVFLVGILIMNAWQHDRIATPLLAVAVLLAPLSWRPGTRPRLIVSPDGITYETSLFTLRAGWGEVGRIGRYRGGVDGIVLTRAAWERPRWLGWVRRPPRAFIPLRNGMGGPYWERGLSDALRAYAPWLACGIGEERSYA